jgi:hypothetical protein
VLEDRADIVYEVRDATNLKPSGKKDWWHELPEAGARAWAERASRRRNRDTMRLGFISSKFRIGGPEPDPFVLEVDFGTHPWTLRDVTPEVVQAAETARQLAEAERTAKREAALQALTDEIQRRITAGDKRLTEQDAVRVLRSQSLTDRAARAELKAGDGQRWRLKKVAGKGRGGKITLVLPPKPEGVVISPPPEISRKHAPSKAEDHSQGHKHRVSLVENHKTPINNGDSGRRTNHKTSKMAHPGNGHGTRYRRRVRSSIHGAVEVQP